jgi:hypothetical protein
MHIDASKHGWFQDERKYELIVILDDATSEIYYAQLVEAESTRSMLGALQEVVKRRGVFRSLCSDRIKPDILRCYQQCRANRSDARKPGDNRRLAGEPLVVLAIGLTYDNPKIYYLTKDLNRIRLSLKFDEALQKL